MDQVARQDYENLEYIIVDGGSTDGTMDLIHEMEARMPGKVRCISEPDRGIYDALNKRGSRWPAEISSGAALTGMRMRTC